MFERCSTGVSFSAELPESAKLIREVIVKDGWQGLLKEACARPKQFKLYHYDLATFYAELADKDSAFAKLNQSVDDNEQFSGFVKVDPFMQSLREDPRYQEILKRVGLPQ
jgi:hypothetical protein